MPQYQVRDERTGKTVTFEWHGLGEPTDADMEEVFAEAAKSGGKTWGQWASDHAPAIGAGLAGLATGGAGLIPATIAAAGGGYLGARLRGDDRAQAASAGATEGAWQLGGGLVTKGLGAIARPLYRAAIPKPILDKFSRADVAGAGLESRVVLGTKRGTNRAVASGAEAGRRVTDASQRAPSLTGGDIQAAFKPKYNKALAGGKIDRANEINAHVKQSMDEIASVSGQTGGQLTGPQQLARKEFLEQEGKSAMAAANANMAPVNPQLANIERKAIAQNLRRSPEMARALDRSQAAIGVERAARATENSSLLNRLLGPGGGLWHSARSPMVMSGAAISFNELSKLPFAQLVRLAQMSELGQ